MEENVKLEIQEKSVFERGIIEAFKQNKVSDVYEKLGIAYSELPLYINFNKSYEIVIFMGLLIKILNKLFYILNIIN